MTRIFSFSIPDDDDDIIEILKEWKAKFGRGGVSLHLRLAIQMYESERTRDRKIETYFDKSERLDFVPAANKEWKRGDILKFDEQELRKLRGTVEENYILLNREIFQMAYRRTGYQSRHDTFYLGLEDWQRGYERPATASVERLNADEYYAESRQAGPDLAALPSASTPGFQDALRAQGLTVRTIASLEPEELVKKHWMHLETACQLHKEAQDLLPKVRVESASTHSYNREPSSPDMPPIAEPA